MNKRTRHWVIAGIAVVVLLIAAAFALDHLAARALREVARNMEKNGYRITFSRVHLAPLRRHLRIDDLHIGPLEDADTMDATVRFILHADEVELVDVDPLALLSANVLHVRSLRVRGPSIDHFFGSIEHPGNEEEEAIPDSVAQHGPGLIQLDTLMIENARLRSHEKSGGDTKLSVGGMDLNMGGLQISKDDVRGVRLRIESTRLRLRHIETEVAPFYSLLIDSVAFARPSLVAQVHGLHLTPRATPQDYHEQVKEQVELYQVDAGVIDLVGFDLVTRLRTGVSHASSITVSDLVFDIHRDKSIPRGPFKRKPLPSETILAIASPLSVDSILLRGAQVRYSERLKANDHYGTIAFTDVQATITGVSNLAADTLSDLLLVGDCRIAGQGHAHLELRMPMGREGSPMSAHATVVDLPAPALNRMTDDLVHVTATKGTIHRVTLDMAGNDLSARATVDMRYEDLKLGLSEKKDPAKVLSTVANAVVRGNNMPDRPGYRKGTVEVRRDQGKSVFNYIWVALREGMLEVMLPSTANKEVKKMGKHKK